MDYCCLTWLHQKFVLEEICRENCFCIHKEIVKLADFSNTSKEDLMNKIDTLLIDVKILNKRKKIET